MNYGPANFYDDGVRPRALLKRPQQPPPAPFVSITGAPPTINAIIRAVCIVRNITEIEFNTGQHRNRVQARRLCYYLARVITRYSYAEIGRRSGGRDHTAVLLGYRTIKANFDKYAADIAAIKKLLGIDRP